MRRTVQAPAARKLHGGRWADVLDLVPGTGGGQPGIGACLYRFPARSAMLESMSSDVGELPDRLTLDEAYRAAFYLVLRYLELEREPRDAVVDLVEYLWTDPARWDDWCKAVARGLADGGLANPDHEGQWQERPPWPKNERSELG